MFEPCLDLRQAHESTLERKQVARVRVPETDASDESFDVVQSIEKLAQILAQERVMVQLIHCIEPRLNQRQIEQRLLDPPVEQPRAHRRHS